LERLKRTPDPRFARPIGGAKVGVLADAATVGTRAHRVRPAAGDRAHRVEVGDLRHLGHVARGKSARGGGKQDARQGRLMRQGDVDVAPRLARRAERQDRAAATPWT
jgi:hypothetical protein